MSIVKNFMEDVVAENLDKVIRDLGACGCEKCRQDISALALNYLPTKYVATEKGQLYTKLSMLRQQFEVDVLSAITNAVMVVKTDPRHTKEDLEAYAKEQKQRD